MLPFLTQPAVAPACYVPKEKDTASVLFDGADNVLSRMAALGNRRKFTIAGCVMRGKLGAYQAIFSTQTDNNNNVFIRFQDTDELQFALTQASSQVGYRVTTAKYRDTAPLLFVASCDTTKGPGNSPMRLSVNGPNTPCTILDPALNYDAHMNVAGTQYIGRHSWSATGFLDGLVPNLIVVDGADLDWSVFFEQNIHGVWVWKPKVDIYVAIAAAGGWGVNGGHLSFGDPLNPGKDVSGKGNHWTATGFDSSGKDTVVSTSSNVYATLNPLSLRSTQALAAGNLEYGAGGYESVSIATQPLPETGKFRAEYRVLSVVAGFPAPSFGVASVSYNTAGGYVLGAGESLGMTALGTVMSYASDLATGLGQHAVNDVIDVFVDMALRKAWFRRNGGGWFGGDPALGTGGYGLPAGQVTFGVSAYGAARAAVNFGQRAFLHPGDAAYRGLCTSNLPEPEVKDPAEALAQATATGANILAVLDTGAAHWNGQWVEFIKRRDTGINEDWRVRWSDDPANAMPLNGTAGKAAAAALVAGGNYWGCRLRVGAKYGVATAEVNHVNGMPTTVTHGLGKARNSVILKFAGAAGGDWRWWHPDMTAGQLATLNGGGAAAADTTITAIGTNSFQIASTAPSGTYRWLVIAEGTGQICLTSHIGSGAADTAGAFSPSSVRPELFICRRTSSTGDTMVVSAALNPINPATKILATNLPVGETTYSPADLVVGGVKLRGSSADGYHNTSSAKYVSIQIGRPIGGVCVAPATAR